MSSSGSPARFASEPILVRNAPVSLAAFMAIVRGAPIALDGGLRAHLQKSVDLLDRLLREGTEIYGVTTGFGSSVGTRVPSEERVRLALNLVRFHGCGTGPLFSETEARAIVVARLASLLRGCSAVRYELVERLCVLLNAGIVPAIPSQGSVGASGDLTPLSYVAAVLLGEREVLRGGEVVPTANALRDLSLSPIELRPKESLALMNGTSVMTGLACIASERAFRLSRWASRLTAVSCEVMRGQPGHFDERLFVLKPHPGQALCASWIREDLGSKRDPGPLQDRYSLRCAPHVIGVALDSLAQQRGTLEAELNSVNDNPILDVESGSLLHGGNFYGGHVCQAMDTLKTCVANVADLLDRQLLLSCDPATNRGLPANLVSADGAVAQHGFKAMQITTSALVAEACKLCMPASVFSRSTENHNQDKVSMGTIAARDCLSVLDMAERVAAIVTLALVQAVDLRGPNGAGRAAQELHRCVRAAIPKNVADRRMDRDTERLLGWYREGSLPFGEFERE